MEKSIKKDIADLYKQWTKTAKRMQLLGKLHALNMQKHADILIRI